MMVDRTAAPRAWTAYLSLFTSMGTLVCCALPSLLVLLGLGATVASLLAAAPWLVWLSRQKDWVFAIAGLMLAFAFLYEYRFAPRLRATALACAPDDPACRSASRFSRVVLWISAGLFATGAFVAYLLGPLLEALAT
jgi:hypothetical protein